MASFSERHGYKEVRTLIQHDELDKETRTDLWNVIAVVPGMIGPVYGDETQTRLLALLWTLHWRKPRDEQPVHATSWRLVKQEILGGTWIEALDVIEVFVSTLDRSASPRFQKLPEALMNAVNDVFEKDMVGFRFVDHEITPLDSATESESVDLALQDAQVVGGARHSLERAVELLSDRQDPDYPNSIKESISAVEAVVKKVTDEQTLGAGLRKLEAAGLTIHPALKEAWSKMYGWTSDAGGIRHAGIEAADADQALAKYALVTCSAFVSYLIEAGRKTGLLT